MKKRYFYSLVAFLFVLEQGIKLIINTKHLTSNQVIINNFLYFRPMFNRDYSWINSLFNLGVSKAIHIILVGFIVLLVFLVYQYLVSLKLNSKIVSVAFAFLLAGGLCSFVDKVFWDGSLDYIYVQNHFTFDLKDVFINVFIGLMVIIYLIDHQGFRTKESNHILKNFMDFLRKR